MCDNLNLSKVNPKRDQLLNALKLSIVPKLNEEENYTITVAYNAKSSDNNFIKVVGVSKKEGVSDIIIKFYDWLLYDVDSFVLLIVTDSGWINNWDITLLNHKDEMSN